MLCTCAALPAMARSSQSRQAAASATEPARSRERTVSAESRSQQNR